MFASMHSAVFTGALLCGWISVNSLDLHDVRHSPYFLRCSFSKASYWTKPLLSAKLPSGTSGICTSTSHALPEISDFPALRKNRKTF